MSISFWNKNTHQETVLGGISGIFDRTKNGLVPQAPSGSGTSKYLREDGNWIVPPNDTKGNVISTYAAQSGATQSDIATVINDDIPMDDAIKTLLDNDTTLNSNVQTYTTYSLNDLLDTSIKTSGVTVNIFSLLQIKNTRLGEIHVDFTTTVDGTSSGLTLGKLKNALLASGRGPYLLVDYNDGSKCASIYFNGGDTGVRAYSCKANHTYILVTMVILGSHFI